MRGVSCLRSQLQCRALQKPREVAIIQRCTLIVMPRKASKKHSIFCSAILRNSGSAATPFAVGSVEIVDEVIEIDVYEGVSGRGIRKHSSRIAAATVGAHILRAGF